MTFIIVSWCAFGLIGFGLLYADSVLFQSRLYRQEAVWCPAPKHIFFGIICPIFGIIPLLVGIAVTLSDGELLKGTWWNRSVCNPKENR